MPIHMKYDKNIKTLTSIPGWAEEYNASDKSGSAAKAYLSSAWAFRAVNIRADAIGSAPLLLYDANDEEIEEHPVLELLDRVNTEWNKGDLWRYTESAFCVYGAAYWLKVRAGNHIAEIQFLNPASIKPEMTTNGISGFTQMGSVNKTWPREDIIYFRGSYDPNSDLSGIAPLSLAALAALAEKSADQYASAFFANYAVPPLLLTTDQLITDSLVEKVSAWWKRMFQGANNQFKTGVVGSGLKPVQLSSSLKDMALETIRGEMHKTICVALGVDELLLSSTGAADRTPVDAALYHLYTTTIIPRWRYYEEVLNVELLSEYPDLSDSEAYLEFDQGEVKPLQDDQNEWAKTLALLVEKKILKPEVVAVELGYTEEDVPEVEEEEPEPVPAQLQPFVESPEQSEQPMPENEDTTFKMELDKWKRKAINAMKKGKPANVDFVTTVIPEQMCETIMVALANAKSEMEVKDAFNVTMTPEPKYESGIFALTAELKRANDLLERTSGSTISPE